VQAVAQMSEPVRAVFRKQFPNDPTLGDRLWLTTEPRHASMGQPPDPPAASELTHPDTYLAGLIRYELGWFTFKAWQAARVLGLAQSQDAIAERAASNAGLTLGRRAD